MRFPHPNREWTGSQSTFCASEIPFPFLFEPLPLRLRMTRFRWNSFVETNCIPKTKLQEHVTRIPPLILAWLYVMRNTVIPCVSAEQAFSIYTVCVSLWSVWATAEKAYRKYNYSVNRLQKTEGRKVMWLYKLHNKSVSRGMLCISSTPVQFNYCIDNIWVIQGLFLSFLYIQSLKKSKNVKVQFYL